MFRASNNLNINISGEKTLVQNRLTNSEKQLLEKSNKIRLKNIKEESIKGLSIKLFTKEEILRKTVVEIDKHTLSGYNSVNDPRMGSIERNVPCETCGQTLCDGHLGYIKLAKPLFHPFYIKTIAYLLSCLCHSCGALLATEKEIRNEGLYNLDCCDKIKQVSEFCFKSQACCHRNKCKFLPRRYCDKEQDDEIYYEDRFGKKTEDRKNKKDKIITPEDALKIFKCTEKYYEDDLKILGLHHNKPSDFIIELFIIIPPIDRLPVEVNGQLRHDNLTKVYASCVKLNNDLNKLLKNPIKTNKSETINKIKNLKFFIRHIMQNSDCKMKQPQPIQCLTGRIKGKEGLIRGNMMGKRTDNTARTVASPDPNLDFGEVLFPRFMASTLTCEVKVANYNINYLQHLFNIGKILRISPGQGISKGSNFKISDRMIRNYKLQVGDTVHRSIQDGDYSILNRQPTLHRQSMLGHKIRLSNDPKTRIFGMTLNTTPSLNADFDGDEVNNHIPQSIDGTAEVINIFNSTQCLIHEGSNKPIMGLIFDNLLAVTKLTRYNRYIEPEIFYDIINESNKTSSGYYKDYNFNLFMEKHIKKIKKYNIHLFSSYSLFSSITDDLFYKRGNPKDPDSVIIIDGVLIQGNLNKSDIGNAHRSIIQVLYKKENGCELALKFINKCRRLLNRYLMYYPVSIGYKDCFIENKEHRQNVKKELHNMKKKIYNMGHPRSDPLEEDLREREILNIIKNTSGKIDKMTYDILDKDNPFILGIDSGSKGTKFNIGQVMSKLGQQYLYSKRITKRTKFYTKNDLNPESQGYIFRSFGSGLNCGEYFSHTESTRVGILDTTTKVPLTGSTQRRFVKFLENVYCHQDGTVRNLNQIIQFVYGYDGCNASEMIRNNHKFGITTSFIDIDNNVDEINHKNGYFL